jgi:hypothetical protein
MNSVLWLGISVIGLAVLLVTTYVIVCKVKDITISPKYFFLALLVILLGLYIINLGSPFV